MLEANEDWDAGNVEDPEDTISLQKYINEKMAKSRAHAREAGKLIRAGEGPITGPGGIRLFSVIILRKELKKRNLPQHFDIIKENPEELNDSSNESNKSDSKSESEEQKEHLNE